MRLDRAERRKVMALAQARRIDAVLVTELSRWGRSTTDLLATLKELEARRVSVVALNGMTFDLATPHGRMMATVLAGIADDAASAIMRSDPVKASVEPGLWRRSAPHNPWARGGPCAWAGATMVPP